MVAPTSKQTSAAVDTEHSIPRSEEDVGRTPGSDPTGVVATTAHDGVVER